jgi:hypothetical protein
LSRLLDEAKTAVCKDPTRLPETSDEEFKHRARGSGPTLWNNRTLTRFQAALSARQVVALVGRSPWLKSRGERKRADRDSIAAFVI